MELFDGLFVSALLALVFACVIVKWVSVVFYDDKVAADKVKVVGQVRMDKGLRVEGSRSKKKVKFVDDVVVRHIDQFEFEEERLDFHDEIKRVVSDEDGVLDFDEDIKRVVNDEDGVLDFDDEIKTVVNAEDDVCDKVSENIVGILVVETSEIGEILKRVDEVGNQGINEVMLLSDTVVGVYNDEAEKESKIEEKSEDIEIDESFTVNQENVVISSKEVDDESGSKGLVVEEKMESEEVSEKSYVELVDAAAVKEESGVAVLCENIEGSSKGDEEKDLALGNENVAFDDDDDWEGIERTELEKVFAEAVKFVECGVKEKDDRLANLAGDVQMQLNGFHKIAVEGPCHEPPPMAINFSARAKWVESCNIE